jgi:hypothetical protein
MAQQLMEWSQQSRENVMELIQREVRKQLKAVGLATSDDIDALRKRVRDLEKSSGSADRPGPTSSAARRTTTAKRSSSAKKSTSRSASAKRTSSSAKSSTAKRPAAKRSTAKRPGGGGA